MKKSKLKIGEEYWFVQMFITDFNFSNPHLRHGKLENIADDHVFLKIKDEVAEGFSAYVHIENLFDQDTAVGSFIKAGRIYCDEIAEAIKSLEAMREEHISMRRKHISDVPIR